MCKQEFVNATHIKHHRTVNKQVSCNFGIYFRNLENKQLYFFFDTHQNLKKARSYVTSSKTMVIWRNVIKSLYCVNQTNHSKNELYSIAHSKALQCNKVCCTLLQSISSLVDQT
ncbi:hypothetical protein BpHYR1_036743 [Brachionus plicatilis]|uniref:Uncharacterized protein n=1 Tax=Brachionus plicatilis TaxID=10195 RepID=A0A3M7S0V4_BRAPC|nr:hypothetical protein BpHYR1_036743 [Brachionus plicatilis]